MVVRDPFADGRGRHAVPLGDLSDAYSVLTRFALRRFVHAYPPLCLRTARHLFRPCRSGAASYPSQFAIFSAGFFLAIQRGAFFLVAVLTSSTQRGRYLIRSIANGEEIQPW